MVADREAADTDPLVQAVEAAVRAGIVVVVSAGNVGKNPKTGQVGYGGITSPGNAPSAITVGAVKTLDTTTRTDDVVADYSSRGPTWYDAYAKPDLVAPGHRLLGFAATGQYLYQTYPTLRGPDYGTSRDYVYLSGTSMATGVVSGSVALLIEASRTTFGATPTPNTIKAMLMRTAFPMSDASGTPYHVLAQGAGAVNPAGAPAHAAQCHHRLQRDAGGGRLGSWRRPGGQGPHPDQERRTAPALAHQRRARHVEDRGGPARAVTGDR